MQTETVKEQPVAQFTGHCPKCGSAEMWTDKNRFGCDSCGSQFTTENDQPINTIARRD